MPEEERRDGQIILKEKNQPPGTRIKFPGITQHSNGCFPPVAPPSPTQHSLGETYIVTIECLFKLESFTDEQNQILQKSMVSEMLLFHFYSDLKLIFFFNN